MVYLYELAAANLNIGDYTNYSASVVIANVQKTYVVKILVDSNLIANLTLTYQLPRKGSRWCSASWTVCGGLDWF